MHLGFFVTHQECFLPFVLIHQRNIKRMLLKIPNFGQKEGERENEEVREGSVWFAGRSTELRRTIPKPQHCLKSASQRFPLQVIVFPFLQSLFQNFPEHPKAEKSSLKDFAKHSYSFSETDSIHSTFKKPIYVKPSCHPCVPAWLELVPCNLWKAPCYSAMPLAGTDFSHICKWNKQKIMYKTSLGTGLKRESGSVIYFCAKTFNFLMGWRLKAELLTPVRLDINKFPLTKSAWDILHPKLILHLSFLLSISSSRGGYLACRWYINQKLLWQYRHNQHVGKPFTLENSTRPSTVQKTAKDLLEFQNQNK